MVEKKVKISNKLGLHARPSALFVKLTSKYKADVTVLKDGMEVNGKSIMSLMMLAAEPESELVIRAEGEDESEVITALEKLVESNFNE